VTHVVVLSDTHVQPGGPRRLPDAVYEHLARAELILHAGDVTTVELLDELEGFAPVRGVLGNNDGQILGLLPETQVVDVDGYRIAMVHDSGPAAGRARRLHRQFPGADMGVFGHSHLPLDEGGVDGQRLFNPGSPTWKRLAPTHTIGLLDVVDATLVSRRIVDV
jgi:putative phosphoesterase